MKQNWNAAGQHILNLLRVGGQDGHFFKNKVVLTSWTYISWFSSKLEWFSKVSKNNEIDKHEFNQLFVNFAEGISLLICQDGNLTSWSFSLHASKNLRIVTILCHAALAWCEEESNLWPTKLPIPQHSVYQRQHFIQQSVRLQPQNMTRFASHLTPNSPDLCHRCGVRWACCPGFTAQHS